MSTGRAAPGSSATSVHDTAVDGECPPNGEVSVSIGHQTKGGLASSCNVLTVQRLSQLDTEAAG